MGLSYDVDIAGSYSAIKFATLTLHLSLAFSISPCKMDSPFPEHHGSSLFLFE